MLVVANWKSYVETREEAKKLFALAKRLASSVRRVRIVLAPSTPHLGLLAPGNRSKVAVAAQDISDTTVAAATGEVSGSTLRNIGATYVIVGHSERRARGETDAVVVEKVRRALVNGLTPILCVGERERDADAQYLVLLKSQISSVFSLLSPKERLDVILAYEPVWAIGKHAGDGPSPSDIAEMVLYIRKVLSEYL
ncbi:MAG TPA: triose-phosphate isomerase, partial [Candidatus Paceibacterota bacterium]|nr:triose-phosphate isomerase [Candidatus Paceibacterota bacterium]